MKKPTRSATNSAEDLGKRLAVGDATVLDTILWRLGPVVRNRIRSRFGRLLVDADIDDVLSIALFRLWKYRDRFDPAKGTLQTWFYLIARTATLDLLRSTPPRPLQLEEYDFVDEAMSQNHQDNTESETTSEAAKLLTLLLAKMSDLDQRILLSFASTEGQGNWASELAAELGIPASTVRSRKKRALARLCNEFKLHGL